MQKFRDIKSKRGSALVGVMALTILLAMGAAGFVLVSGNSMQDETQTLADEMAFQAAESGLLMGTRWLRANGVPSQSINNVLGDLSVNGMQVTVDIQVNGADIQINSRACGGILPYTKRVAWSGQRVSAGWAGTFVKTLNPGVGPAVGGGGLNNVVMDGPFHVNEPIIFSSVGNPQASGSAVIFKNGPVSVYNHLSHTNFVKNKPYESGDWGNYGDGSFNNYDFGVFKHDLSQNNPHGSTIDATLTDIFRHSQDSLIIGPYFTSDITLPNSELENAQNQDPAHRPTLVFHSDGSADYYTWSRAGNNWSVQQYTLTAVQINDRLVRVPGNDLNVLGTFRGSTTIMTDSGYSIFPVGSLKYAGFNPLAASYYEDWDSTGNYGIGPISNIPHILGLISGEFLYYGPQWIDPRDGGAATAKDVLGDADGYLYFMCSLMAVYPDGSNMWKLLPNGDISFPEYQYNLRFIGSRCIDRWFNYTAGGTNANSQFRCYYDTRLSKGLQAIKMPIVIASSPYGNLMPMELSGWMESNI